MTSRTKTTKKKVTISKEDTPCYFDTIRQQREEREEEENEKKAAEQRTIEFKERIARIKYRDTNYSQTIRQTIREENTENERPSRPSPNVPVDLSSLLAFIFPDNLQHPLAAARLFIYCDYGPLIDNQLRSGAGRSHTLAVWELDSMCLNAEREDIIKIFLHRARDFGVLTSKEHEAIVQQADGHLKKAKGKSMLPALTKADVVELMQELPRDEFGNLNFHDIQKKMAEYREWRIKEFKLVFPSIKGDTKPLKLVKVPVKYRARVSASVAPPTMFMKATGQTNADVIDQTNQYLSKYAYSIRELDDTSGKGLTANVRLLREVAPALPNERKDAKRIQPWESASMFKGTGLGSKVKAVASSSTWKRKTTIY